MDKSIFGEGISPLNPNQFIELSWQENKVFVLDRNSLQTQDTFSLWDGVREGWGITLDA